MNILEEYVKSTGVDYIETDINDNSSMKNVDEQTYINKLYHEAMLPDSVFAKFIKDKIDCSHVKEVIKRSEEKDINLKNDTDKKKKLIEDYKKLIKCEEK